MRLASIDLNVRLCMGRLFPAAAPATQAETSSPPVAATPAEPAAPAAPPAGRSRVVVVASGDAEAESIGALPVEISQALAGQPVEVVSTAETRKAFGARAESLGDCQQSTKCREAVARGLGADVIVTATLDRAGKGWQLTMTRSSPGAGEPRSTSERMKKLSNLTLNVRLCVGRLFTSAAPAVGDLTLDMAAGTPPPAAGAPVTPVSASSERVVVVAAAAENGDRGSGVALAEEIAKELAAIHPAQVVPAADVQRILTARDDSARDCLDRQYCAAAVASKLDAGLVVTATVEHSKGTYLLTMTSGKPLQPDRQITSERMRQLSSLGPSIRLCLSRLFSAATAAAAPAQSN